MILSPDEKRCQGARRKAAAFASDGQNGREASKGRGSRDTRGMKGWCPSAIPKGPKPVRAFCGRILAGHRIDRPVFFRDTRGSWSGIRGPWGSLFALIGSAAAESDEYARASAIMKNGASPSPRLKRQGRTRNEGQGNDTETRANGQRRRRPVASFQRGSGARNKKGPRGRRNALIRLDSAKEIQGFSLL